jgi:dienelactone hydrolase
MRKLALLALLGFRASAVAQEAPPLPPPEEVKAGFLKLLDRPKVPADPDRAELKVEAGFVTEHFSIATEKKIGGSVERVPILLVRPEKSEGRRPAVIVLHGTGGSKEGQRGWCLDLAKRGMIGVAIDARYHGERSGGAKGAAAYDQAIARAWRAKAQEQEHPFYYDTVWDLWRTVDYLVTRADVDPERLGMIGFSMGGIETWLAASVDDRIRVAVPAIGVQSFKWSLEHHRWQGRARTIKGAHEAAASDLGEPEVNERVCRELWGKVIPGILGPFDGPSMIRLFAGRPLLILSGEQDPNCPIEGARLAFAAAETAFQKASAPEKLKILVHPGGHSVPADQQAAAKEWFEKWLK